MGRQGGEADFGPALTTRRQINMTRVSKKVTFLKINLAFRMLIFLNSLNGPVKDCLGPSYTDRFKTKRRFITKNANVAKFESFTYCNP